MERAPSVVPHPLPWWVVLLPGCLAGLVYAIVLGQGLAYDDPQVVQVVQGARSVGDVLSAGRSLHYLLLYVETVLHGGSPWGYHLTSVLCHAIATTLAVLLTRRLTGDTAVALLCGCLFAVHPVHTEAIASVANRKDVLATVLVLGAVLCRAAVRFPWVGYVGSLVLYAAALAAKEVAAVGAVGIFFLVDLHAGRDLPRRLALRRALVRALPILSVAAVVPFLTSVAATFSPRAITATTDGNAHDYLEVLRTVLANLPDQARLLFAPFRLSPDYPVVVPAGFWAAAPLLGMVTIVLWIGITAWAARSNRGYAFGSAWIAALWLPCANLVPLSKFFVAERYLYGPSFGACLVLALAAKSLHDRARRGGPWWRITVVIAALGVFGMAAGQCIVHAYSWRNDRALMESALAAVPEGTWRIHLNLAESYGRSGDQDSAARHYARLLELRGNWVFFERLIDALARLERYPAIEQHTVNLLARRPGDGLPRYYAGLALARLDRRKEAIRHFQDYLRLEPRGQKAAEVGNLLDALARGAMVQLPAINR